MLVLVLVVVSGVSIWLEFKFIQWSLCVLGSVGMNNITYIIGYHMV